MNMEELTKSQIVLLGIFVSFFTSIATGIVTVSLVEQAPPAITQSVSRVIQETVQTVAPAAPSQHAAATVTQKETVIVNESDLIAKAVERVSPSVVKIYGGPESDPVFLSLGVVLDASGTVATDELALADNPDVRAVLSSGSEARLFVRQRDEGTGLAYLAPAASTAPGPAWVAAAVSTNHPLLGESVVALSGKSLPRIASGLIVALVPTGEASTSPRIIDTDIAAESVLPGSPLIDTEGAIVGVSTAASRASSDSGFMSSSALVESVLK